MKKFLALAALIAGVALTAVSATAGPMVSQHWVTEPLKFRTHTTTATATTPGAFKDEFYVSTNDAPYAVDSSVATNSAAKSIDTTTAMSTVGWAPVIGAGMVADSTYSCTLNIYDGGITTDGSGTDSLYVFPQASFDGKNWFSLGIPGVAAARITSTNRGLNTIAVVGQANVNGFGIIKTEGSAGSLAWQLKFPNNALAEVRAIPSIHGLWRYPLIRFLIMTDVSAAATYQLKASVSHWSASEDLNSSR